MSKKKHNNNQNKDNKKNDDTHLFFEWLDENKNIPDKDNNQKNNQTYKPFSNINKEDFKIKNTSKNNINKEKQDDKEKNLNKKQDSKKDDTYLFFQWLGETDDNIPNKDKKIKEEDDSYKKPFLKEGKKLKKSIKTPYKKHRKFFVEDEDMLEKWLKENKVFDKDGQIKKDEKYMYPPDIIDAVRIDTSIDLHGLKVEDAIFQLKAFVKDCFNRNDKVIKVIHGKGLHSEGGTSILRKAVWNWLNSEGKAYISFFRKATKKHGGSGAVIIWLK